MQCNTANRGPARTGFARGLTGKQQRFVEEYLVSFNATQAALDAGYSARTAYSQGQRLLKNVEVKNRIEEAMARRAERFEIKADRVLLNIARIASGDIRRLFNKRGELKPIHELDEATAAMLAGFDIATVSKGEGEVERVVRVRLRDTLRANELLARHLTLFRDSVDVNMTGGDLGDRLDKAVARAAAARRQQT
jgi:phage terminase small subunit